MNRFFPCICLIVMLVLTFSGTSAASDTVVSTMTGSDFNQFWERQYADLEQQIVRKKALGKTAEPGTSKSVILDTNALILDSDRDAADVIIRRTRCMLDDIKKRSDAPVLKDLERKLLDLTLINSSGGLAKSAAVSRKDLFMMANSLNRSIMISDPLITFDSLVFITWKFPDCENHLVNSHMAYYAHFGAGMYILKGIKTSTPVVVDFLQNSVIQSSPTNNRLKGKKVTGGAFLTPEVSFDGKTILFAWTDAVDKTWHIMKVNSDGSNLVALTDGLSGLTFSPLMDKRKEDFDPCWLPSGRIAFISERRGGYGRCHTYEKPSFTLYSMKADGTDMYPISYHETNEWNPSVANDGNLVFSRWDYIDRDDCIAHHLWVCGPDGSDPRAPHGNYPLPLSTMTGSNWADGRWLRPNAEFQFRACPAPSMKYVATAGAHHSPIVGEIILIDPTIRDDGKMSQIKGITTNLTRWWDGLNSSHDYATPWPLSEQVFLCGKGSDLIYIDKNGNQQILYHNSSGWRAQDPIPLIARTRPPELASKTWQGERAGRADHYRATIGVLDVRVGDMSLRPQDTVVSMRIVQVIPQENAVINQPRVGYASESLVRLSLGTVPVEADGSVYCEAPVGKEVYFQLLNKRGLAVRSMRSGTFVHEGEQLTCVGCHEDKWTAPPPLSSRIAFKRPPSKLVPEIGTKVEPVGFYRTAKPVFDAKCTPCHLQKTKGPDGTYASFKNYAFWWPGEGNPFINGDIVTPIRGGSRCLPGMSGAMYAQLTKHLDSTHYNVKLTDEMFRRVTLWLDLNSNELTSANASRIPDMKLGKLVWPAIDIDTNNLHGIEMNRPVPGAVAIDAPSEVRTLKATPDISVSRYGNFISIARRSGKIKGISLFDVSGRAVFSRILGTAVSQYTISMTEMSLPRSTYILKVTGDNHTQSTVRVACY